MTHDVMACPGVLALWFGHTSSDLFVVAPDALWVAREGRVGRCGRRVARKDVLRARAKRCKKNDDLGRPFCGANLNLRNGYLTGLMPAVSVLIPEAFRPINHLTPAVTLSNEISLAIYTPQHPQKGRASSS